MFFAFLVVFVLVATLMLTSGDPETRLAIHLLVLAGEVNPLALVAVLAALRQGAGASGKLRLYCGVLLDPVGKSILTVLDNSLRGLVAVIGIASLARSYRGVVNELKEVLAEPGDNSELLAVLTESVELVSKGGLKLLAGNIRELGLSDKRLGLSADEVLLEYDNFRAVRLLVLELRNLIRNLLLTVT